MFVVFERDYGSGVGGVVVAFYFAGVIDWYLSDGSVREVFGSVASAY